MELRDFYEQKEKEVMKKVERKEVPILVKSASIPDVLKILHNKEHTWIVDNIEDKTLVGVITEKDFFDIISPLPRKTWVTGVIRLKTIHHTEFESAEDLMRRNPISCSPEDIIEKVLDLMRDHRIKRLAVVESKKLIGEVTLSSIIRWYGACSLLGRSDLTSHRESE